MSNLQFPSASFTGIYNSSSWSSKNNVRTSTKSNQSTPYEEPKYRKPVTTSAESDDKEYTSHQERDADFLRTRSKYREIRNKCLQLGTQFTDLEFPAKDNSLFTNKLVTRQGQVLERKEEKLPTVSRWQRPGNISLNGRVDETGNDWILIKDPRPSDIRQGQLGNCWFIAALTLIAERKELLQRIFITRKYNKVGVYALRLFKDGQWTPVIIDDLFPCDQYNRLVFSKNRHKQLWVPLIEKAMAKLHGNYASLQSGTISDGLNYLTGFVSECIEFKSEEDRELLWGKLLSLHDSEFLMGAHITCLDESKSKQFEEAKGLITNHVYSVLNVIGMKNHRLIQLRNPWGRFCWKGDWSDNSLLWTEEMKKILSPSNSDEGIFWISYQDFIKNFTSVEVCKVRKNWKIASVEGILPPYADPDCQPCFELICYQSCEVDISLYQSSKRNAREVVKQTDIGMMLFETNGSSSSSKRFKLAKPVELTASARTRSVSCNLLLTAGSYCLVPFSFGHWTTKERDETFYTFALTIHSSRDLKFSSFRPVNYTNILADALICCSKYFGDRREYSLREYSKDISTISLNLGYGHCTILENQTKNKYVELEVNYKGSNDYTRDAASTKDKIGPLHCQVVQVLTVKDTGKSSSYQISYQLCVTDSFSELSLKDGINAHTPPLNDRIAGLHQPRPIQ